MPVVLNCEVCGDEFEVPPSREDNAKYCSQDCYGKSVERDEDNYTEYTCQQCGDVFEALKSRDRDYCSKRCSLDSQ